MKSNTFIIALFIIISFNLSAQNSAVKAITANIDTVKQGLFTQETLIVGKADKYNNVIHQRRLIKLRQLVGQERSVVVKQSQSNK